MLSGQSIVCSIHNDESNIYLQFYIIFLTLYLRNIVPSAIQFLWKNTSNEILVKTWSWVAVSLPKWLHRLWIFYLIISHKFLIKFLLFFYIFYLINDIVNLFFYNKSNYSKFEYKYIWNERWKTISVIFLFFFIIKTCFWRNLIISNL